MKNIQIKMKTFGMEKVVLAGLVSLLAACSTGGVYSNAACGIHPKAKCTKSKVREEQINLAADALFKFDRYAEKDLLNQGRDQLDDLAHKLANHYIDIESLTLVGHTDRLGSVPYNNRLGLNRAKTIRAYLQSRGVDVNILAKTAGESQPVTDGCHGVRPQVKLRACLQPDRRVVVKVLGIKKTRVNQCAIGEDIITPVEKNIIMDNPNKDNLIKDAKAKASQMKNDLIEDAQAKATQMQGDLLEEVKPSNLMKD